MEGEQCLLNRLLEKQVLTKSFSEMTKWKVDNLVTHICALALIIDNFETDVNDIREDLGLDNKQFVSHECVGETLHTNLLYRITQYFHEIGCAVTPPTEKDRERLRLSKADVPNHRIARLRIPLDFPKQRIIAQRRPR